MTHHSVAPGVLPPQFILKSFLHTILKSVLGIVLEFLTIQRGPPDDTSRWTNKPKWGFICTVIGGEGHKENLLVLTAFLHRSAPFGEGVAFHLRIGLQRDTEWFERLGLFNFDARKVKSVHALLSYDWFGLVSNIRLLFVGSHFIRKTPLLLFRSTNSCPSATTDMPQGKSEERATPKYLHCPWMMAMLLILVLESEIMCFDNIHVMCFTWDDVLGDGRGWALLCFG